MKQKLFAFTMALLCFTAISYSQVTVGIRAGVNLQNINGQDQRGDKLKNDLALGFHAGADVEIAVADPFFFQLGVLYSTKGAKNIFGTSGDKVNLSYVEVPLHFVFKPELGAGRLILGLGPYLAYGIGGSAVLDGNDVDVEYTKNRTVGDVNFTLKPLDAGADVFFGYEFPVPFYVQVNAQLGLLDLMPKVNNDNSDAIIKNTGFGVSVGYRFGGGGKR
ncbi:MAG TPA: porin family protein [Bacteroidales bacterium]|nr:porin family protein [Bacteroidales bacterium]